MIKQLLFCKFPGSGFGLLRIRGAQGQLAVLFEGLVCGHGKGLLLHDLYFIQTANIPALFSVALNLFVATLLTFKDGTCTRQVPASPVNFPWNLVRDLSDFLVMRKYLGREMRQYDGQQLLVIQGHHCLISWATPNDPIFPNDEMRPAAAFSPHRGVNGQPCFPDVPSPGWPCPAVEIDGQCFPTPIGARHDQRAWHASHYLDIVARALKLFNRVCETLYRTEETNVVSSGHVFTRLV